MARTTWQTWAKRVLTVAFLILIPVLLYQLARNLDWNEVRQSLLAYKPGTLVIGLAIAVCSYLTFASYDLLARAYTGHQLPARQVLPVAFVCYAFNLNFTTWVGGVALRYRLYGRLGLDTPTITRILTLGLLTNWMGYMLLAGSVFALGLVELPGNWAVGTTGLRLIGVLLLAITAAYLLACGLAQEAHVALARARSHFANPAPCALPGSAGGQQLGIDGAADLLVAAGRRLLPRDPRDPVDQLRGRRGCTYPGGPGCAGSGVPRPAARADGAGHAGSCAVGLSHPVLPDTVGGCDRDLSGA